MESNFDWREFERNWTNAIIDSINAVREAEGITVKQLRARLARGGWGISEATLSGMLSGKKRGSISIAELTAFAWALSVPPMYLMLGLPAESTLPDSPMWSMPPTPPRVADWVVGRTLFSPHPDADLAPGEDNDEGVMSRMASQSVQDVMAHARESQVIQWQAAQLIAIDSFGQDEMLERVTHPSVRDQTFLWEAINSLSSARRFQRGLGEWGIDFGPLPEVLGFIDDDEQADDFTVEQLRSLTSEPMIERARKTYQQAIDRVRETMPEQFDGAPTNPTE